MSDTYTTISGDLWDYIAYKTLGSEKYMDDFIAANLAYRDIVIFSGGIVLNIPNPPAIKPAVLPPWRR